MPVSDWARLRPLLERLARLPRHPFKLARALVRSAPYRSPKTRPPGVAPLILVAHDDQHLCEGIRDILELENYRVILARSRQEVLALCEREIFDAMIIRYPLERETSEALIAAVRRIPHCQNVPLIVMIVIGSRDETRHLSRYDVSSWLVQPFDPEDLLATLQRILRST